GPARKACPASSDAAGVLCPVCLWANAKASDGMHIQIRSTRPVQSKTLREAAASGPDTPESALKPAKRRKKLQSRHSRTALSAPRSATSRMLLRQHPARSEHPAWTALSKILFGKLRR